MRRGCLLRDLIDCADARGVYRDGITAHVEVVDVEPVTLVVTALAAGAAAGLSGAASAMVTDAYQGLKGLVLDRLRGGEVPDADLLVDRVADPAGRDALTAQLSRVEVDEPTVAAAEHLLELLKDKGKFVVDASQAKGIIVGDHAQQHNTFH